MNAETPKAAELNLPQAFLLLATNDKDGKPEVPVYALRTTLAGAILAELDLIGAIGLQGKHVRATGTVPQTDYQHELELIRGKSRPHTPKRWVSILEGRAEVQRVYERMESLGIVEHVGEKHLGRFRVRAVPGEGPRSGSCAPAKDPGRTQRAVVGTRDGGCGASDPQPKASAPDAGTPDRASTDAGTPEAAAADSGTPAPTKPVAKAPDARTLALIALLQAAGLFGKLFPAADRVRASELAKDYWPARAVEDELRMIRLAEEEAPAL